VIAIQALVVDGDQPGVLQSGHRAGLALEAGQELAVSCVARIHHLQRHRPVQANVESSVDRRRAPGRYHRVDAVSTVQHGADERVRMGAGIHLSILDLAR
jgi:hypothetical protein